VQATGNRQQATGTPIKTHRDLIAWQKVIDLAEACYKLTTNFPRDELYGLTSQVRRAAVSVAANIAEGYGRQTAPAYLNFLRIALGSVRELETHLIIAERVRLTEDGRVMPVLERCDERARILHALIRKLEQSS
jgi:four helix bundle protein